MLHTELHSAASYVLRIDFVPHLLCATGSVGTALRIGLVLHYGQILYRSRYGLWVELYREKWSRSRLPSQTGSTIR
eukprot:1353383-Rhodomonas_salina.2